MEKHTRQIKTTHLKSPLVAMLLCGMFSTHSIASVQQLPEYKDKMPAPFSWAGPSIGAYTGGAWGSSDGSTSVGSVTDTSYYNSQATINSVNQAGSGTLSPRAFIGGIQFSDNFFVRGPYVVGLIMDYGSLNLSAAQGVNNLTYPDDSGNYSLRTSVDTSWVYTARARLGYALSLLSEPVLLYMTGGLALVNFSVTNTLTDTTTLVGMGGSKSRSNQTGWTVGAGFELPVANNLTINCEYQYLQFGNLDVNSSVSNSVQGFGIDSHSLMSPFNTSANLNANLFKVALNYKF